VVAWQHLLDPAVEPLHHPVGLPLRANKSESFDCLKFTLDGAGGRSNGNALTSAHLFAFFA